MADDKKEPLVKLKPISWELRKHRTPKEEGGEAIVKPYMEDWLNRRKVEEETKPKPQLKTDFKAFLKENMDSGNHTSKEFGEGLEKIVAGLKIMVGGSGLNNYKATSDGDSECSILAMMDDFFESSNWIMIKALVDYYTLNTVYTSITGVEEEAYRFNLGFIDRGCAVAYAHYRCNGNLSSIFDVRSNEEYKLRGLIFEGSGGDADPQKLPFIYKYGIDSCFRIMDKNSSYEFTIPKKMNLIHFLEHSLDRIENS